MQLIIGLGNPGKEYQNTRHNVGFMVLDGLAFKYNFGKFLPDKKSGSVVATGAINGTKILLIKPQTYMNESGRAVRALLDFYKMTTTDCLVIHDDKDLPLGEYRVHTGRGAAGHNGVQSLFDHLGTKEFTRLRIGVATNLLEQQPTADFVLGPFQKKEQLALQTVLDTIVIHVVPGLLSKKKQ